MNAKTHDHWILENELPGWTSVSSWRDYVKQHADRAHRDLVDDLSVEVIYFIGWNVRRTRKVGADAGDYKRFLRAVGGAGDSDWYSTKADMEYAAESEDLYLRSIPEFAAGDAAALQESCDSFVAGHRKRNEGLDVNKV